MSKTNDRTSTQPSTSGLWRRRGHITPKLLAAATIVAATSIQTSTAWAENDHILIGSLVVHRAAIFVSGSRNEQDQAYFEVEVPGQIKWIFRCPAPPIDDPIVHALEDARDTLNSENHFDLRKSLNEAGITNCEVKYLK